MMNKSDLVRKVSRKSQVTQPQVEEILDQILMIVEATLASGESVVIKNFGRFETRERQPTTRRNPRSGEEIKVPQKRALLFHAAPALKDGIQ